jgi:hypothetical protein
MRADSIDDVLALLDRIVADARRRGSRLGYFAGLYRNVTLRVKDGIEQGRFEDGPRMERLDVRFANRYLAAYDRHRRDISTASSWRIAFDAAEWWRPIILQHLLLGMNAHINLDLGIAAAQVSPGAELADLERDFQTINDVLIEMLDGVQHRLSTVSPWLGVLDVVGGGTDELLAGTGLKGARHHAWQAAQRLAPLSNDAQQPVIDDIDSQVARIGERLVRPGPLLTTAAFVVRCAEDHTVSAVVGALHRPIHS